MSYDTYYRYSENQRIPPRRGNYDNFPGRNKKDNFTTRDNIEMGSLDNERGRNQEDEMFGPSFDLLEVRRNFIKKVYGILGLELLLVTAILVIFMFTPLYDKVYKDSNWLIVFFIMIILSFVLMLILTCCPLDKVIRKFPLNILLLTLLVIFQGITLGIISAYYKHESILIAGAVTAATVVVVSVFAFFTNIDFTKCGGIFFILVILLCVLGIATTIVFFVADDFTKYVMKMVYGAVGALVMVLLLIYDTQLMMIGKHKYSYDPEDYVFAVLSLFLDIINLFLYILMLVGGSRK